MAINEPEASLHPNLISSLAALIVDCSQDTQLWVATHSEALASEIEQLSGVKARRLLQVEGESQLAGQEID